jgi:arylsulfatase A-like enzyme/molybdopterin-binding protein
MSFPIICRFVVVVVNLIAVLLPARLGAANERPNVILILVDDLGYGDTRITNPSAVVATPNIMSIATGGVKFTQAYVTAPVCSPSRAGLMTSVHPARYGAENNDSSRFRPDRIPAATIASLLEGSAGKGYNTMTVGKWDLAGRQTTQVLSGAPYMPVARGFGAFYGIPGGVSSYYPTDGTAPASAWYLDSNNVPRNDGLFTGVNWGLNVKAYNPSTSAYVSDAPTAHLTKVLADQAVAFINSQPGTTTTPFFLYLAFNAPHVPYMASDSYYQAAQSAAPAGTSGEQIMYNALLASLDDNVGRMLSAVAAKGSTIAANTLIVFVSDNGNVGSGSSGGLTGGKQTLFEGGIHVPLAMKWPAKFTAGQTYGNPVSTLDLLPTIARAAGVSAQDLTSIFSEGVNLTPFVLGTQTGIPHAVLCWRYVGDDVVVATDRQDMLAVRAGNYKYIREVDKAGTTYEHLYDLGTSLVETPQNNLTANPAFAATKANLITSLNNWNRVNPLDEDFVSGIAYGFVPYHSTTGAPASWTVNSGKYTVTSSNNGDRSIAQMTHFSDATYSVRATISTSNGKAGLVFRGNNHAQGGANLFRGYFAQIATGNTVSLVRVDNGTQTILKSVTATITSGVAYDLRVVATGSVLDVYLNGTFQFSSTDSTYAAGSVGLRVGTTSTSSIVFDDMLVTSF